MITYAQETDFEERVVVPDAFIRVPIPMIATDATIGSTLSFYHLLAWEQDLFSNTWRVVEQIENQEVARGARELLRIIEELVSILRETGFDLNNLPPLHAFLVNDGSILFEWISSDFRVGFSVEPDLNESGWYLVSNKRLGEISASGYLEGADIEKRKLVMWLLTYIFLLS
ncbi:MAG: hypothetical protein KJ069_03415 [Anaerolineae bacterium]|nr:hypothetical protein [Anaerolineae bacterium]